MKEELRKLLADTVNEGLYRITISNPRKKDKAFKIKIRPVMVKGEVIFQETLYEGTKVFHENRKAMSMIERVEELLALDFKQCEVEHRECRATVLVSKKGKITVSRKRTKEAETGSEAASQLRMAHNRTKRYILEEGIPVPFLVDLGVQTQEGRVVHARYDKFRQINRFLEFIEDILPTLSKEGILRIIDFGCGKSYLTFAMYYYLQEIKGYEVEITGLDLKEDVIDHCNRLSEKYGYHGLRFLKGDIADYKGQGPVDLVVTLHACDTATDYALARAVGWNAKVILSVPCCQHEINRQIKCEDMASVFRYGIIKERIAALTTDAVRAELLETEGYAVDILEFIDMEHTPKNLLIRAVKREHESEEQQELARKRVERTEAFLHITPTLQKLLRP